MDVHASLGVTLSCLFSCSHEARMFPGRSGLDVMSQCLFSKRYAFVDDSEVFGEKTGHERFGAGSSERCVFNLNGATVAQYL